MTKAFSLALAIFLYGNLAAQDFKYDNKKYQTISWEAFFKKLESNPKLVYFDIRTQGERSDTSQYLSYNQGRIKGALEADFFNFDMYYSEYKKHKNDTIYLYCSHSRRSRLLASRLIDSSFKHIVNINGGISYLNTISEQQLPLKAKYYASDLKYELLSPKAFIEALQSNRYQIVDVRPDSIYNGTSGDKWQNLFGVIEKAWHIPYDKVKTDSDILDPSIPVILFDNDGELAPIAAHYLVDKGYKVAVLLFGLDNLLSDIPSQDLPFLKAKYSLLLPDELLRIASNNDVILIDVRTQTEFTSTDTITWKNVGRLKNAVNIPLAEATSEKLNAYKNKRIILYDIMMHEELFDFAELMNKWGFNNYNLLVGGIMQVKWEAYNLDKPTLKELLHD